MLAVQTASEPLLAALGDGAKADRISRSWASGLGCAHTEPGHRRVIGRCEPERDPRSGVCNFIAASCLGGIVRRAVVPDDSADFGTGNPHSARRSTRSGFAVDAGRWPAAGADRARSGLGAEFGGNTHLPVVAFRNEASRSCGSHRRDCDAVGGRGFGQPRSRMACFSVRSNASAPIRVAAGYTVIDA